MSTTHPGRETEEALSGSLNMEQQRESRKRQYSSPPLVGVRVLRLAASLKLTEGWTFREIKRDIYFL